MQWLSVPKAAFLTPLMPWHPPENRLLPQILSSALKMKNTKGLLKKWSAKEVELWAFAPDRNKITRKMQNNNHTWSACSASMWGLSPGVSKALRATGWLVSQRGWAFRFRTWPKQNYKRNAKQQPHLICLLCIHVRAHARCLQSFFSHGATIKNVMSRRPFISCVKAVACFVFLKNFVTLKDIFVFGLVIEPWYTWAVYCRFWEKWKSAVKGSAQTPFFKIESETVHINVCIQQVLYIPDKGYILN